MHYVLEGSVRKGRQPRAHHRPADRHRIGTHIWAGRFDGALDDIFELQDQVASRLEQP
jgi:TolB-like protein